MLYKKRKPMQQVDNIRPEDLPVSKDSPNETISLKNNHQKLNKIESSSEEEVEEIDNRTCFQKTCGKWVLDQ